MYRPQRQFLPERIRRPVVEFFETEASGGIVLVAATLAALLWANSAAGDVYQRLWHTPVSLSWGDAVLSLDLHHWVNDGLMALFFFVVGLEIKREILTGELASVRRAALPAVAALGGMVVPALLYFALNPSGEGARGWGIPMATDIAFAVGILMLLGRRVPLGLKVFLTALAVVDDLGAVLVIALFYTEAIAWGMLVVGLGLLVLLFVLGAFRFRPPLPYFVIGVLVWFFFLQSGVHATVAGVLVALAVPHGIAKHRREVVEKLQEITGHLARREEAQAPLLDELHAAAIHEIEQVAEAAGSPLMRLEHVLHPWVAYFVMPVFALANAGVDLGGTSIAALFTEPVSLGVLVGLVVGKQIGVFGAAWLVVRVGWAQLPAGVTWRLVWGAAALAGIGFTMSLFIASLGFGAGKALTEAKMGILAASFVAAVIGVGILLGSERVRGAEKSGA